MSKKIMLLALTAVSAAMFALPAMASAGTWTIDAAENFTVASEANTHTLLTQQGSNIQVTCTGVTGNGAYNASRTDGTISLSFTGCKESVFSTNCNSPGAGAGVITVPNLKFDNRLIDPTTPGILMTPASGTVFSTFTCFGGSVHVEVTGNGVIGDITTPKCGESSKEATIDFETNGTPGVQKYMQVTTEGTKFDLDAKETVFGSTTTRTAAMFSRALIKFTNARQIICEA
jgi:hypothetical protein